MTYTIKTLTDAHGETLYNVPAEPEILMTMGFNAQQASEMCHAAKQEAQWARIRAERDSTLSQTDFTQVGDAPMTEDKQREFATYRQALRDLPQQFSNPNEVIWPPRPTL